MSWSQLLQYPSEARVDSYTSYSMHFDVNEGPTVEGLVRPILPLPGSCVSQVCRVDGFVAVSF